MNANLMHFYHVYKSMVNSYCRLLPYFRDKMSMCQVSLKLFILTFYGQFQKYMKVRQYMEPLVPIVPLPSSVVSLVLPTCFPVPASQPLLDYFEINTKCVLRILVFMGTFQRTLPSHTERAKGSEKYILKEKGKERRGKRRKASKIGTVAKKGGSSSCYSLLFIVTSWIITKSTF